MNIKDYSSLRDGDYKEYLAANKIIASRSFDAGMYGGSYSYFLLLDGRVMTCGSYNSTRRILTVHFSQLKPIEATDRHYKDPDIISWLNPKRLTSVAICKEIERRLGVTLGLKMRSLDKRWYFYSSWDSVNESLHKLNTNEVLAPKLNDLNLAEWLDAFTSILSENKIKAAQLKNPESFNKPKNLPFKLYINPKGL